MTWKDEVRELDPLTFGGGQHRVDLALDCAPDADVDHASVGDGLTTEELVLAASCDECPCSAG